MVPSLIMLTLLMLGFPFYLRYRNLVEHSGDVICLHHTSGKCLYVSSAVKDMFDGKPVCPMTHVSEFEHNQLFKEGRHIYRIRTQAGDSRWLESVVRSTLWGHWVVSTRDVTVFKQSRDLFLTAVQSLPHDTFLLFDHTQRVVVAVGSMIQDSEWAVGQPISVVFNTLLDPKHRDHLLQILGGVQQGQSYTLEIVVSNRVIEVYLGPVQVDSDMVGGLCTFMDITSMKSRETALKERTEDLERSNRDLEQFADIASHELKTPLRHISSFADILAEGLDPEHDEEYLAHITQGVLEMHGVLEALLRYSRAKTNENRMQMVDVSYILQSVLDGFSVRNPQGDVEVAWDTLPTLRGDPVLLRQLLENLIWNGIKFSQPEAKVQVWAERNASDWIIVVKDNGPGVDPEFYDLIFQMFKRSRTDIEGSGIGLALCKKIAGIHRGRIWVESGEGPPERPGAVFKCALPGFFLDEGVL